MTSPNLQVIVIITLCCALWRQRVLALLKRARAKTIRVRSGKGQRCGLHGQKSSMNR